MRRLLGALVVVVVGGFSPGIRRRARAAPGLTPRAGLDADIAECEAECKRADEDSSAADARCASLRETLKSLNYELDEAKLDALSARAEVRKLTSSLGVLQEQRRNLERAARRGAAALEDSPGPDEPVGDALADKAAVADKAGGAGRGLSPVAAARARKKAAAAAPPDEEDEDAEAAEAAPAESRVAAQIGTLAAVAGGTALALGVIEAETLLAAGAATAAAISVGVSAVRGNGTAVAVAATDDAAGEAPGEKSDASAQEK